MEREKLRIIFYRIVILVVVLYGLGNIFVSCFPKVQGYIAKAVGDYEMARIINYSSRIGFLYAITGLLAFLVVNLAYLVFAVGIYQTNLFLSFLGEGYFSWQDIILPTLIIVGLLFTHPKINEQVKINKRLLIVVLVVIISISTFCFWWEYYHRSFRLRLPEFDYPHFFLLPESEDKIKDISKEDVSRVSNAEVKILKHYYPNGQLRSEAPYKDGWLNGVLKHYYSNGQLQYEISYKSGKKEGPEKHYYENGKLESEQSYKNSRTEGVSKYYYENGNLRLEMNFKDGEKEGPEKHYSKDGALEYEMPYKDGVAEGIGRSYYKNGAIRSVSTYKYGVAINIKLFDENGNMPDERNYPLIDYPSFSFPGLPKSVNNSDGINKYEALEIAKPYAQTWGNVCVYEKKNYWKVETNCDAAGGNSTILIDKVTGKVLSTRFNPM